MGTRLLRTTCRLGACLLALAFLVAGCSGDGGDATAGRARKGSATTASTPASTPASTAPTASQTSTDGPTPPPTAVAPTTLAKGVPTTKPSKAEDPSKVGDGTHVAFIKSIDAKVPSMTVDLAELFTGDAAVKAYKADTGYLLDGEKFYIRNLSDAAATLPVDTTAGPFSLRQPPQCGPEAVPVGFDALTAAAAEGFGDCSVPHPPFTIAVADGKVTSAVQLYAP